MEKILLLFRKPNYLISIEKEWIVIMFSRIFNINPSNSGKVYSIGVHTFL